MDFYKGFYAAFQLLINEHKISNEIKHDLFAKKTIIDGFFENNKKNSIINATLNHYKKKANEASNSVENSEINNLQNNMERLSVNSKKNGKTSFTHPNLHNT